MNNAIVEQGNDFSESPVTKNTMRCDAVFHLLKVKTFTKQHLIRIVYRNENGFAIFTNALLLKYASVRSDHKMDCEKSCFISE